mmetsp:Transcript_17145/g.29646  ORF Transcript_17145/g.29646 Transcript_17145/m.29646 type:complete len:376 (-) Transcript_17145:128-1255(-)
MAAPKTSNRKRKSFIKEEGGPTTASRKSCPRPAIGPFISSNEEASPNKAAPKTRNKKRKSVIKEEAPATPNKSKEPEKAICWLGQIGRDSPVALPTSKNDDYIPTAVKLEPGSAVEAQPNVTDIESLVSGDLNRPTVAEMLRVHELLSQIYSFEGHRHTQHVPVLDALVGTILSQNTTDKNSIRAFENLKQLFPTWREVILAPDADLEDAIRIGGLAKIKAGRIKVILRQICEETGEAEPGLEHLRERSTEEVKAYLGQFKGVGAKTIACVLMFSMKRDDFPVDTHVHRLCQRLGWSKPKWDRDNTYAHMNKVMPDSIKLHTHLGLVAHGKTVCQAQNPKCSECILRPSCDFGRKSKGRPLELEAPSGTVLLAPP